MLTKKSSRLLRIVFLAFVLTDAGLVSAHAVVKESSLTDSTLSPQTATQVELFFNSGIELALSQIFLVSKGDKHERLEAVPGNKPGQIIISIPPLNPGEYALRYKIFAADGHLTEDIIYFEVSQ
ncbi:MAG: copper resistance CopC family protein [Pseudomonadota bacterium]